jgi:hypothetical protein
MRLPSWEQLRWELARPLKGHTVGDLLEAWVERHLAVAAAMAPATPARSELPGRSTEAVVEAVRAALRALPAGEVPAAAAPDVRASVAEAVVLGWDLQRAIGAGADPDPLLVEAALGWMDELEGRVWPCLPPAPVPALASATDQLLALCGRLVGD